MNKVIFLDRDGVIIESGINRYNYKPEHLKLIKDSSKAIDIFNKLGYKVIIVTNQSGISKGIYTLQDTVNFNNLMIEELKKQNPSIKIDNIYICPHSEKDNCYCRKPRTGLFIQAYNDYDDDHEIDYDNNFNNIINFKKSYVIGDSISDIEAGHKLGCKTILVLTGKGTKEYDNYIKTKTVDIVNHVSEDLYSASNYIKNIDEQNKELRHKI